MKQAVMFISSLLGSVPTPALPRSDKGRHRGLQGLLLCLTLQRGIQAMYYYIIGDTCYYADITDIHEESIVLYGNAYA